MDNELTINRQFLDELKFDDKGLIPVIVQDYRTNEVLMLAYMNRESLEKSLHTGTAHYWSRSRNKLWQKGETSGHYQYIKSIDVDCDGDTLLLKVCQQGVACHTGYNSCFYRALLKMKTVEEEINGVDGKISTKGNGKQDENGAEILEELYHVITDRKVHPKEGSYTNYLFEKGLDKILKKVGEEASEVIIAAKNKSLQELKYEISDLVYHTLVLMVEQGLKLDDIYRELKGRR
ncbi:MAG: bifunctional phosphoribosyl-AMP cyclohydrolase/phosphoribosyl-ATP diphosphatase HisIE [Firmicutes bacterium]|nr:bifunctional phosphoribosyl-AMP cyclohydrolase/phosphoribosyl-ATP diphosphatase HisIE [Bacillota bacterium]